MIFFLLSVCRGMWEIVKSQPFRFPPRYPRSYCAPPPIFADLRTSLEEGAKLLLYPFPQLRLSPGNMKIPTPISIPGEMTGSEITVEYRRGLPLSHNPKEEVRYSSFSFYPAERMFKKGLSSCCCCFANFWSCQGVTLFPSHSLMFYFLCLVYSVGL